MTIKNESSRLLYSCQNNDYYYSSSSNAYQHSKLTIRLNKTRSKELLV